MAVEQEGFLEDEGTLGGPKFDPPLYLQRYNAVIEVARKIQARKVQWQSRIKKCDKFVLRGPPSRATLTYSLTKIFSAASVIYCCKGYGGLGSLVPRFLAAVETLLHICETK